MHKPLSSSSDLLNHYHKAAGHGTKTSPSPFHLLPFLFITYNLIYLLYFQRNPENLRKGSIFYLSSQVAQAANALSNAISSNQPGCDGFVKPTLLSSCGCAANETERSPRWWPRYILALLFGGNFSISPFFKPVRTHVCVFVCVCLRSCLQMRKIGSEI